MKKYVCVKAAYATVPTRGGTLTRNLSRAPRGYILCCVVYTNGNYMYYFLHKMNIQPQCNRQLGRTALISPSSLNPRTPLIFFLHKPEPATAAAGLTSPGRACMHASSPARARAFSPTAAAASTSAPASNSEEVSSSLGVVIVDHGSRKKASNDMLFDFVDLYKQVTGRSNVEAAHMEIAEPTIAQAVAACAARGARRVVIAPYFLSRGRHIQQDIPALVEEAQAAHPEVECVVADPIGVDPLLAQLIEARVVASEQQ